MLISEFEWDDGNALHLALGHGIEPEEAEEVFAGAPLYRKTKRGHYAAFGPTSSGRLLVIIFEIKPARPDRRQEKGSGRVRAITGWDMDRAERRYYQRHKRK